jgi:hypothetical protein
MGYDVIAVDTGSDKQKLCASLGADHFIDFKTAVRPLQLLPPLRNRLHDKGSRAPRSRLAQNIVDEINKLTNGGAHAAIVVASGAAAYNQGSVPSVHPATRPSGAFLADMFPSPLLQFAIPGDSARVPSAERGTRRGRPAEGRGDQRPHLYDGRQVAPDPRRPSLHPP